MAKFNIDDYEPHDEIYLQPWEFPDTTWCVDQIDEEHDIKYLLATPEREAAHKLYEALKDVLFDYDNMYGSAPLTETIIKIHAALVLVKG